jgi:hypothetical protein
MNEMSVKSAADLLGLSEQRVRALLKVGRIDGHKLGSAWIVEGRADLAEPRPSGRPLGASNAWALLALLSDRDPDWVDPSVRSRLRRWIGERDIVRLLRESEPRSEVYRWRVLAADVARIESLFSLVRSGLSAARAALDIVPIPDLLDAYVDPDALAEIRRRFRPEVSSSRPNILLRVPVCDWILAFDDAPEPVAAADLLPHDDPRVSRAAAGSLKRLSDG